MPDNMDLVELGDAATGGPRAVRDLEAVYDIPVTVSAVLGKATMQVSQLLKLGRGAVVELDRKLGEAIDIYVNNRLVARGEVVMVDDNRLGVTMTEIVKADRHEGSPNRCAVGRAGPGGAAGDCAGRQAGAGRCVGCGAGAAAAGCAGGLGAVRGEPDVGALVRALAAERIAVPVVACGTEADSAAAVQAIRDGAREFLPLPADPELIAAILQAASGESHTLIARDPAMLATLQRAEQVAAAEASVLITGESGTGKEIFGAAHPSPLAPGRRAVRGAELCGHSREFAGVGDVRP